jgi:hypothetical protein
VPVTVTFSGPMDASTINTNTILLRDAASTLVPATVSYNSATTTATLTPSASQNRHRLYRHRERWSERRPTWLAASERGFVWNFRRTQEMGRAADPYPHPGSNAFSRAYAEFS